MQIRDPVALGYALMGCSALLLIVLITVVVAVAEEKEKQRKRRIVQPVPQPAKPITVTRRKTMKTEDLIAQGFIEAGQQPTSPSYAPAIPQKSELDVQIAKIQADASALIAQTQTNAAIMMKQVEAQLDAIRHQPHVTNAIAPELGRLPWGSATEITITRSSTRSADGSAEVTESFTGSFNQAALLEATVKAMPQPAKKPSSWKQWLWEN